MKNQKETRTLKSPVIVKRDGEGKVKKIVGYPIVYNKASEDMGFTEYIAPGAATEALKSSDIRGLKNHNPDLIFARKGVNLELVEDKDGVRYEATPINTRNFEDVAAEVEAGLLTGQSFGFKIEDDEWKDLDTDHPTRTITKLSKIFDVGPVTYPAYTDTTVALRSLEAARSGEPPANEPEGKTVLTVGKEVFEFDGDDQFDRAVDKLNEIKTALSPTTPGAGEVPDDEDPTVRSSQTGNDEVVDKINKFLEEK